MAGVTHTQETLVCAVSPARGRALGRPPSFSGLSRSLRLRGQQRWPVVAIRWTLYSKCSRHGGQQLDIRALNRSVISTFETPGSPVPGTSSPPFRDENFDAQTCHDVAL